MYRTPLPFYNKCIALGHTNACFACDTNHWFPPQLSRSQPRWAARGPYPQVFPGAVFSQRCPWGLLGPYCVKPVKKNTGYEIQKRSQQTSSPRKQPLLSQPSKALLCLAQSNQCADYCTTALSWTGSLNTGPTGQELQKLPSGPLKSSLSPWEQLHSALPPGACCTDWAPLQCCDFQSWRGTFATDWGTGNEFRTRKRGRAGLESPYMGWCHPGEVWVCAVPLERPLESPALRHGSVRKMVPDVLV